MYAYLVIIFLLIAVTAQILTAASAKAQRLDGQTVSMALKNASLLDAFKQIEGQTDFRFMYRKADVAHIRHLSLPEGKRNLAAVLEQLLQPHDLSFRQVDNKILIQPALRLPADTTITVQGRVTGDDGNPVIGATVIVKGTGKAPSPMKTASSPCPHQKARCSWSLHWDTGRWNSP